MDIRVISAVLAASTCLFLTLNLALRKDRTRVQDLFVCSNLSLMTWNLGDLFVALALSRSSPGLALFFDRVSYVGSILYITFYALLVSAYLDGWSGLQNRLYRTARAGFFMLAAFMGVVAWTPLLIKDVQFPPLAEIPGPLLPFYAVFFVGGLTYSAACLFIAHRSATGSKRSQLKYLGLSLLIIALSALIYFFTLDIPDFFPVYYYGEALAHGLLFYAIVKHQLLDITVVFNKILSYSLMIVAPFAFAFLAHVVGTHVTPASLPGVIAFVLVVISAIWAGSSGSTPALRRSFVLLSLCLSILLLGSILRQIAGAPAAAFWDFLRVAAALYLLPSLVRYGAALLGVDGARSAVLALYASATLLLPFLVMTEIAEGGLTLSWAPRSDLPIAAIILAYFVVGAGAGGYALYRSARSSAWRPDAGSIWVLVGGLGLVGCALNAIRVSGAASDRPSYLLCFLWIACLAYAILRHEAMGITWRSTRAALSPYIEVIALIPVYLVILGIVHLFTGTTQYLFAGLLLGVFALAAGFLVTIENRLEMRVGKILFSERYDAYETLTEFSKALVTILDLATLSQKTVTTLASVLRIDRIMIFLFDVEADQYYMRCGHGVREETVKQTRLRRDDPFIRLLHQNPQPLLREDLGPESSQLGEIERRLVLTLMDSLACELCIPLNSKERLVGFLGLGCKGDGNVYSQGDLALLCTLGSNAAIALDNAMLYEDLKRSQILVRRTDRLRSLETIAGGFAHEIRNPLTSIKTFVQLAPDRKDDMEFIGYFSKVVSEDVDRIERLIKEILDYARYMEPKLTEQDLNEIVGSCLYFIEVKAENKSIRIEKDLEADLPRVMVDRQQIKQVLLNLFLNAMDAMSERGGGLTVRTHALLKGIREPWVQIEVADTGSGIAPADLEHIFDPFYSTKHKSDEREGTGLGLTIVHQIVQEHAGYIEVTSEPGVGTTFYVNLPVNPLAYAPVREHHEHEKTSPLGR